MTKCQRLTNAYIRCCKECNYFETTADNSRVLNLADEFTRTWLGIDGESYRYKPRLVAAVRRLTKDLHYRYSVKNGRPPKPESYPMRGSVGQNDCPA
jgi:hypothetical protein